MSKRSWISISGLIWAFVGALLLYKGLRILSGLSNSDTATLWVAAGLLVGFVKGRFVLAKTAKRLTDRIASLQEPIQFSQVYPKSYWLLLASMMGMGALLRLAPADWHGFVDVAVGSALMNGAMLYFKAARSLVVS